MSLSLDVGNFDLRDPDLSVDSLLWPFFDQVTPFEYCASQSFSNQSLVYTASESYSINQTGVGASLSSNFHSDEMYVSLDSRKRSLSSSATGTGTLPSKRTRRFETKEQQDETAETRKKGACLNCQKARQRVG
jgi:hypothetical protein